MRNNVGKIVRASSVHTTRIELHRWHDMLDWIEETGGVSLLTFVFLYTFGKYAQGINNLQVFIKFHFLFAFVRAYLVVSHKCLISMGEDGLCVFQRNKVSALHTFSCLFNFVPDQLPNLREKKTTVNI